ncbi:MAG: HEXXH motif-containing putative peptide modification protein, partial [Minwuiales bacterium]|nr:HEXXH motif-containing putative peptide modification protein [Minwuiales bacterium]
PAAGHVFAPVIADALDHRTHTALFALAPNAGVVTNDPAELHDSPLRKEKRPLEGILHATVVVARLTHLAGLALRSGRLDDADAEEARELLTERRKLFEKGIAVLDAHARYTDEGRMAIDQARRFMAGVDA